MYFPDPDHYRRLQGFHAMMEDREIDNTDDFEPEEEAPAAVEAAPAPAPAPKPQPVRVAAAPAPAPVPEAPAEAPAPAVSKATFCPYCGTKYKSDTAKFCSGCGRPRE